MGAALSAVPRAFGIVRSNPILLVGAVLFGVIGLVGAVLSIIPLLGVVLAQVLVLPVALVGLTEMTDSAAADDDASLGDFAHGIADNAASAIGAFALLFGAQLAIGITLTLAIVFIVGVSVTGAGPGTDPTSTLTGGGAIGALLFLVLIVALVTLALVQQFLDVAVVVGDRGAVAALGEAKDILVEGPLSVLGYALLRFGIILVAVGIPAAAAAGVGAVGAGRESGGLLAIAAVVLLLAGPVAIAVATAYHVAYYRTRRSDELDDTSPDGSAGRTTPSRDPLN
jgi:hypothetical protein